MTRAKQIEDVFRRDEVLVMWRFVEMFLVREQLSRLVLIGHGNTMMLGCVIALITVLGYTGSK
jgi:hypothetical protein